MYQIQAKGYRGAEDAYLMVPRKGRRNGTEPGLIAIHGHGGGATNMLPGQFSAPGRTLQAVADAGWLVYCIDAGTVGVGAQEWGNADVMAAMDAAYTYLTTTLGAAPGLVDLYGNSMGGLEVLNWMSRNFNKVRRCLTTCAAVDLIALYDTGLYTAEMNAAYGNAANRAAFITNSTGYNPAVNYAAYRGKRPLMMYHGTADTVVPISQMTSFVASAADSKVRGRIINGANHTSLHDLINVNEVVEFYQGKSSAG